MSDDENAPGRQEQSELASLRERVARAEARDLCDTSREAIRTIQAIVERHDDHLGSTDARLFQAEDEVVKLRCEVAALREALARAQARDSASAPARRQRTFKRRTTGPAKAVAPAPASKAAPRAPAHSLPVNFAAGKVDLPRAAARTPRTTTDLTLGNTAAMVPRPERTLTTAGGALFGGAVAAVFGDSRNVGRNMLLGAAIGAFLAELTN